MLNFEQYTHLTFDCYGTLIDWETGILSAVKPVLAHHGISLKGAEILQMYARYEAEQEAGDYQPYRDVLRGVMAAIADETGFTPTEAEQNALPGSVGNWPPFADTIDALQRLKTRYKLVIVSNIDDAMFAASARRLHVPFDDVITAQRVGSYKPSRKNFQYALNHLDVGQQQVLHVAQSLFHDHVPAKELGFDTVWVNRESTCPDTGISLPAEVTPDVEVPDMKSLVEIMGL